MTDPWSDPSSPAAPPYVGPPPTTPPSMPPTMPPSGGHPGHAAGPPGWYAPPGYGPGYGAPYGYPQAWGPAPTGPRRPGQVVAASVLAFVQAAMVLLASLYVFFFASIARTVVADAGGPSSAVDELATEGSVLAVVQVLSVVALVVGGVLVLGGRPRRAAYPVVVGALAVQVALALYWAVRLATLSTALPTADPSSVFAWFTLLFAPMPVVALGLVLFGPGRRWLRPEAGVPA